MESIRTDRDVLVDTNYMQVGPWENASSWHIIKKNDPFGEAAESDKDISRAERKTGVSQMVGFPQT